jgi:hypothetical protein
MKILVTTAALLFTGAAQAQTAPAPASTPPAAPANSLTRDLNSGPPAPAVYLAPVPATPTAPVATAPTVLSPVVTAPPRATPAPVAAAPTATPAPTPTPTPMPRPAPAAPTPEPEPASGPEASVSPPAAPAATVLDSAARAALPFSAQLPPGFEITTGRPGPDFRIYTIRRGDQSFVMIYTGPASQFPIYSGQMVEVAGRASILSTENGVRHAMEHLFQRATSPREVHVWTMSLDGPDRVLAEEIAQSVDVR